jgi:hypothetical protein
MAPKKMNTFSITVEGVKDTFANTCRKYDIPYCRAYKRKSLGWTAEDIFEVNDDNR